MSVPRCIRWVLGLALTVTTVSLCHRVAFGQSPIPTWNASESSNVLDASSLQAAVARPRSALAIQPQTAIGSGNAPVVYPQVMELARALKYSPDLIYEYVNNDIQTIPEFGSLKGPLGTVLDGSGTAFDQAELMQQLLQIAAGSNNAVSNPQIVVGQIHLTATQLASWLGTSSASSVSTILTAGGFSASVTSTGDTLASVDLEWAWVTVSINGTTYAFDPATKSYAGSFPGYGAAGTFAANSGFSQSQLINDFRSGQSGKCTYQFNNLGLACANFTAFTNDLRSDGVSFASYLTPNANTISPQMAIGGNVIAPQPRGEQLRQTSLPYQDANPTSYAILPAAFRTTFGVQMPNTSTFPSWNTADLYGHRLSLVFSTNGTASLNLDAVNANLGTVSGSETTLTSSSGLSSGQSTGLALFIAHPYGITPGNLTNRTTSMDGSAPVSLQTGTTVSGSYIPGIYDIVIGLGPTGQGMVEKHRKDLQAAEIANPNSPNAEPVLGESLAVLGYSWLAERSQAQAVLTGAANATILVQQELGVVGMKGLVSPSNANTLIYGPYLDIPTNTVSVIQRAARLRSGGAPTQTETGAFFADQMIGSSLEANVIKQTQPGVSAFSTSSLIAANVNYTGGSRSWDLLDINNLSLLNGSGGQADNCAFYAGQVGPSGGDRQLLQADGYLAADVQAIDNLVGYNGSSCQTTNPNGQPFDRVITTGYGNFFGNPQLGGAGYLDINQAGTTIRSLITGNLSGGLSSSNDNTGQVASNTPTSAPPDSLTPTAPQIGTVQGGGSAVQPGIGTADLLSGAFTYSHTDLSVGSGGFPYELSYTRSYDSGNRLLTSPFGNGWSGSIQNTAATVSDPFEALGTISAVEASPAIASLYAAAALLTPTGSNATPNLEQIAQGASAVEWFVSNFTVNNAIAVTQPGSASHFLTLGNGTFLQPPGSSDTITSSNGVILTSKAGEVSTYDAAGHLVSWTSPAGPQVSITYQNPGSGEQPVKIANNMGRAIVLAWSGAQLASVGDSFSPGRVVRYGYDPNGNLTTVTDATGVQTTSFSYDATRHLTGITTPSSDTASKTAMATIGYDSLDRLQTLTDADGHAMTYNFAGSRSEVDDAYNDANVTYFDPRGNAILSIDPDGDISVTSYDFLNRKTLYAQPDDMAYLYTYDAFNDLTLLEEDPPYGAQDPHPEADGLANRTQYWSYDPKFHHVASAALGWDDQPVSYVIDPNTGLTSSATYPAPNYGQGTQPVYAYTYDGFGRVTSQTLPDGTVDAYTYTANEDLLTSTVDSGSNELNLTTHYGYDGLGDVNSVTTPNGNTTTAVYDALRRPTLVSPPADSAGSVNTTATAYDLNGQVASVTVRNGLNPSQTATTSSSYDAAGNLVSTTDASGRTTQNSYDLANRVVETQQLGTSYASFTNYDPASRVVSHAVGLQDAAHIVDSTTYTPGGRVAAYCYYQTPGTCQKTTYIYDGFGRPWYTFYPDGTRDWVAYSGDDIEDYSQKRGGVGVSLTFDSLRRVTQRLGENTIYYTYDSLNRPVIIQENGPLVLGQWEEGYDRAGRVTSEYQPWITGAQSDNGAAFGNTLFSNDIAILSYGYDNDGNVTSFNVNTTKGTFSETISYDRLDRPDSYNFGTGGNWQNLYDFQGRRSIRGYNASASGAADNSFWNYDNNGTGLDLTQVFHQFGPSSSHLELDYTYNNAHQVSGFDAQSAGTTLPSGDITPRPPVASNSGTITYNNLNQAVLSACTNVQPCYDNAGDLINDGTRSFTYDSEGSGRITSATNGSTSALYAYDPWGRRIGKVVNGVATAYILTPRGHEVAELTNGQLTKTLYYDPSDTAPIATADTSGNVTYNYADKLGSVVLTTQGSQITNYVGYLPYGDTTTGTLTGTAFGYAGYRYDAETGLYHTATRSYDPKTGRFLQPDPIGYQGGRNLYAYAGGDPVNNVDPGGTTQTDDESSASEIPVGIPYDSAIGVPPIAITPTSPAGPGSITIPGPFGYGGVSAAPAGGAGSHGGGGGGGKPPPPKLTETQKQEAAAAAQTLAGVPSAVTPFYTSIPSSITDAAYQGSFHDIVVSDLAAILREPPYSATVLTEMDASYDNTSARLDILAYQPGLGYSVREIKTGTRPSYTDGQEVVLPQLPRGGVAVDNMRALSINILPYFGSLPPTSTYVLRIPAGGSLTDGIELPVPPGGPLPRL